MEKTEESWNTKSLLESKILEKGLCNRNKQVYLEQYKFENQLNVDVELHLEISWHSYQSQKWFLVAS